MNPDSKTIEQSAPSVQTIASKLATGKGKDRFELVVVVVKNVGEIVYIALKFVEKYVF